MTRLAFLVLLFSTAVPAFASANIAALEEAEKAFQEKDFLNSHKIYLNLYQTEGKMSKASLLYNAGVSAFHGGKPGLAYGLLLKAKKLSPSDSDILHNLSFIKKALMEGGALITEAKRGTLLSTLFKAHYLPLYLFLFLSFFLLLLLQYTGKVFFPSYIKPLFLVLCLSFTLASYASHKNEGEENAVLVEEAVARSGPRVSFPEISTLKEGTLLRATQVKDNWRKIYFFVDRKMAPIVAWIPNKSIFSIE